MNFTRDPIIETVITPKEGCKLVVRSSKGNGQEDYYVDALEVVSFGHSFFFRSIERPKSFLVPVSDYEIFEEKEPKLALKNASPDRSFKIGGGRDSSRSSREGSSESQEEAGGERPAPSDRGERKRDRGRRRGRRGRDRHETYAQQQEEEGRQMMREEGSSAEAEMPSSLGEEAPVEAPKEKAPSFISKLFPPPTSLIKDTIGRYKSVDPTEEDLFPLTSTEPVSFEENSTFEEPELPLSDTPPNSVEENGEEE